MQSSSKCCNHHQSADHHLEKNGNRRAEYKQSITMYRVVPSCTFATIASAVKAQNTWPWHRHMWRGSYLSRLDFSKVSSASTHAHKSPEPRCYLPTTNTRANKGNHLGPNQNPNFFQERCTTQSPHNYHTGTAWKKPGKGAMAWKKTHIELLLPLLLLLFCGSCPFSVSPT